MVDAYLAAAALLGLVANAALGWWWADPLAGLVVVFSGLKEAAKRCSTLKPLSAIGGQQSAIAALVLAIRSTPLMVTSA